MNTFALAILSLDYHILLPLSKNKMSLSPSTLGDLGTLGTCHTQFLCQNQVLIVCMTQDQ
jgi:hypothetical protein